MTADTDAEPRPTAEPQPCSACGRIRSLRIQQAPLGGPGSYGLCEECDERAALPAWYVDVRCFFPDWEESPELSYVVGVGTRGSFTVYQDGRYVPLRDYLEERTEYARRLRAER